MLFPEATDQRFADGYAQAVTFGLLMARASNVSLKGGIAPVIKALKGSGSLIGSAIQLLVDESNQRFDQDIAGHPYAGLGSSRLGEAVEGQK